MINTKKESRMKKQFYFFAILLTMLSSCKKDDNNNPEGCYSNTNAQTIVHDGLNREYVLYIPDSYDGTSALPLMMNFHGYSQNAGEYIT